LSPQDVLESGNTHQFDHDQVQQTADGLVDAKDRMSMHLEFLQEPIRGLANQYLATPEHEARFIPNLD
jgi:hypothetical protein